jgi:predicted nuclease with RNAse H fold
MRVIGIDLSGPSNHKDTVLTVFEKQGNQLRFVKWMTNVSDLEILKEVSEQGQLDELVIGIDAPLSYEDGGGDRQGDRELRKFIVSLGMKPGSIMPPTLNKMVYLTLRGIRLSREIQSLKTGFPISIIEVHPGAVIGSRLLQNEFPYVLSYKQNRSDRSFMRSWLEQQNLAGLPIAIEEESHSIDACAAALGAWHWKDPSLKPKWVFPAAPPLHPYSYCC